VAAAPQPGLHRRRRTHDADCRVLDHRQQHGARLSRLSRPLRGGHGCDDASQLFSHDSVIIGLVYATMAIPLLFGLFWGAPLLAREFEDGTHNLAWTQGVTRRRWLSGNAAWALLAAPVWVAAMAALVSWWRGPENALGIPYTRSGPGLSSISRGSCRWPTRYSRSPSVLPLARFSSGCSLPSPLHSPASSPCAF
jgi:hypothetical protein